MLFKTFKKTDGRTDRFNIARQDSCLVFFFFLKFHLQMNRPEPVKKTYKLKDLNKG